LVLARSVVQCDPETFLHVEYSFVDVEPKLERELADGDLFMVMSAAL
jgi:hypothetical protein